MCVGGSGQVRGVKVAREDLWRDGEPGEGLREAASRGGGGRDETEASVAVVLSPGRNDGGGSVLSPARSVKT